MKPLIFISVLTFSLLSSVQPKINELVKAFKSGDAQAVSDMLDNSVQITIDRNTNSYNKQKASAIISVFFRENRVLDFKVLHQSENNETAFCIGNLSTSAGVYRVTFFAKEKGGKTTLQELKIEK